LLDLYKLPFNLSQKEFPNSPALNPFAMLDDPRIKRVLKRYRKDDELSDGSMDVTSLGVAELLKACRHDEVRSLNSPIELDEQARAYLARRMGIEFDVGQFDYFLHAYVRTESVLHDDPTCLSYPAPESGPPAKIPLAEGKRWVSVRPKDGQEHYVAYEIGETKGDA